uniref:Dual specificity protein phosphatase 19 n=1 Tax=Bracon brevicornis TaxID=1563983 RepID=A0A6V7IVM1_9HYME
MDLSSQLKNRKSLLKPTKTVVTNFLGEKFELQGDNSVKKIGEGFSFVVDNKPDLQVAPVAPGVFLSSQDPVAQKEILEKYKIKHILSLGIMPNVKFDGISYHFIEILDVPEFHIDEPLQECLGIIGECKNDNILVHCNAGVSRSATVVVAWIMSEERLSFEESLERVRSVRPCVRPNDGFVKKLKLLEKKLIE